MSRKTDDTSNVIPLPITDNAAARRRSEEKWGSKVMQQGFCILPSILLRAQERIGLNATELAVIVHLADIWWYDNQTPWVPKAVLARRLQLSPRQVQRIITGLEEQGYVRRVPRRDRLGQRANGYDLSGLVKRLKELAPEFAEAAEMKKKVERRGGLKRISTNK